MITKDIRVLPQVPTSRAKFELLITPRKPIRIPLYHTPASQHFTVFERASRVAAISRFVIVRFCASRSSPCIRSLIASSLFIRPVAVTSSHCAVVPFASWLPSSCWRKLYYSTYTPSSPSVIVQKKIPISITFFVISTPSLQWSNPRNW